jgi:hypothetical protein
MFYSKKTKYQGFSDDLLGFINLVIRGSNQQQGRRVHKTIKHTNNDKSCFY